MEEGASHRPATDQNREAEPEPAPPKSSAECPTRTGSVPKIYVKNEPLAKSEDCYTNQDRDNKTNEEVLPHFEGEMGPQPQDSAE
jgi:hypothetical protein